MSDDPRSFGLSTTDAIVLIVYILLFMSTYKLFVHHY